MNIKTLKVLGLTTYEASAYIALCSLVSASATEISEASSIPRSKIYDVLKHLNEKDFITVESGRPLKYHVKTPNSVLTREKEILNKKLDNLAMELNEIYEHNISQVQAPIWRIFGVENIIAKEIEIIKRSKSSLNMRIGFLFENEAQQLVKVLKNKNIPINILASPYSYIGDEKVQIIEVFDEIDVSIYKADIPFVKMLISDSNEMLHIYARFYGEKKKVLSHSAIGIWNKYEDIAKNYDDRFLNQFNKIKLKKL